MPTCDIENNFSVLGADEYYWLGFLWADGSISSTDSGGATNRVRLQLAGIDKAHVVKFQQFVKPNQKIYERKDKFAFSVEIADKKLVANLQKQGIVTGRCHKPNFLPKIPKKYITHFLRGYFDGDGTIGIYQSLDKRVNRLYPQIQTKITCTDEKIAQWLLTLIAQLGISFGITKEKKRDVFHIVSLNKKEQEKFLKAIYENSKESTRLDRKYTKSLEALELLDHLSRTNFGSRSVPAGSTTSRKPKKGDRILSTFVSKS